MSRVGKNLQFMGKTLVASFKGVPGKFLKNNIVCKILAQGTCKHPVMLDRALKDI